jgi:uncharacterized protein YcbX
MPSIADIWTYPVKSLQGHRIDNASLGDFGISGDRIWAIRDLERGGIRGAKKIPGLMQCSARFVELNGKPEVLVTLPDGTVGQAGDPAMDKALSAFLHHRVELVRLPDAQDKEHFRRGAPDSDDVMTELRSIFGRDLDEPLPNLSVFPPEVSEFESPPGAHYDCYPLMVMSTSALEALHAAVGTSGADIRRFRPSVVVDTQDASGNPEFGWKGRRAQLGTAQIEFLDPCPRCVMVTHLIDDDAPADRSVLRHIVRELDQNLGVYGRVIVPGQISPGDALSWLN